MERHRVTGVLKLYREAMQEIRFMVPERRITYPVKWYLNCDHLARRPLYGIYAMAQFAEYLLFKTKKPRKGRAPGRAVIIAAEFFAETRRAMQNVLSTYPAKRHRTPKDTASIRRMFERLLVSARDTYQRYTDEIKPRLTKVLRLSEADAELLEKILTELSLRGTIPRGSKLYRGTPLTPFTDI